MYLRLNVRLVILNVMIRLMGTIVYEFQLNYFSLRLSK